jgi:transcriptional regulator with XRE-family HTH domain
MAARKKPRHPELVALGQRIARLREARGFETQRDLAEACGMETNQVQVYESGTADLRYLTLLTLARGLEVDVASVVSDAYPPDAPLVRARPETDWIKLQDAARALVQVCTDMAAYKETLKRPGAPAPPAPPRAGRRPRR